MFHPASDVDIVPDWSQRRIGIIDIGSNSIRLVAYDGLRRTPIPVFNEKVLCGLGRGLDETGRLDPEGVRRAHENLSRFVWLAGAMGVQRLIVVATAAVRDAEDGADFVADVERRCRVEVEVLSGRDEAQYAALGLLSAVPDAEGVTGDLGGGSLELVRVDAGETGAWATLPLGPLRFLHHSSANEAATDATIREAVAGVPWLGEAAGRTFYPVGGAWRSLARIHMEQTHYPLHVIDHYTVQTSRLETMLEVVMRQTPDSFAPVPGLTTERLDTLPLAARVLLHVLHAARPAQIVFSAQGLREGLLYSRLSRKARAEDPLLAACRDLAAGLSRFDVIGEEVLAWTAPLFPDESPAARRLREAACLIADIGWSEHPDYRAEHAFYKAYRLPGVGIDHAGRAFLALTLLARYGGGSLHSRVLAGARSLVGEETARRAEVLGLALRVAVSISGGSKTVLDRTALELGERTVTLRLSEGAEAYLGDVVRKRLAHLAAALGREPRVLSSPAG